jgi:HEAT repeat protein/energy-coupling factor transporter ATP-binding protein EcfA2
MANIYVSSTSLDLQEHRERLDRMLRRLGHEDVAREFWGSKDEQSVERRLMSVGASDIYIGIFAWRYGSIPVEDNPDGISFTEMEFRAAIREQKPCLIFLLSDDAPWPPKFIDRDRTRIERLRNELVSNHKVEFFRSAEDLVTVAASAIARWAQEGGFTSPTALIPERDFSIYFAALNKRYGQVDLNALTPPQKDEYLQLQLRSVFIEQNVREDPPPVELPKELLEKLQRDQDVHAEDLPEGVSVEDLGPMRDAYLEKSARPVIDILSDKKNQRVIILGNPGSGKSTLARYVLLSLIGSEGDQRLRGAFDGWLPLLIELRSYTGLRAENRFSTFLEFLDFMSRNEAWGLNKETLHHYLKTDGRAIVIFDGLDEIFDPTDRERIASRIVEFSNDYPNAHIIVTSRVIGYRRKILTDAGFKHFTLQDLDEQQVAAFVDRWYSLAISDQPKEAEARRERILSSFQASPSVRQLAGNPMLLTIMAIIGKHQELPRERWKLYEHAASVLLQHWDVNKHLVDHNLQAESIGEEDKKELLRRLAYKMQAGEGGLSGNYIHRDQLESEIKDYLTERYNQSPERARVLAQAMIEQLRERNFILALYGANLYGFVHRAFLEYFCASAFVTKFEKSREIGLDQLKTETFGAHWKDQPWHEVLRLICGMINEKFAGELIDCLIIEAKPDSESEQTDQSLRLLLAVQCLTEIRNLSAIAEPARRLLEGICSLLDSLPYNLFSSLNRFIQASNIIRVASSIGPGWPKREVLVSWLRKHPPFRTSPFLTGPFIGLVGKGHEGIHQIILDYANRSDQSYRRLALSALATGWPDDPQTLPLLRRLAIKDEDQSVRAGSLSQLLESFRDDPQTLPLLKDWAVNAKYENVRAQSIELLGFYFRDDSETMPLLQDWATKSIQPDIRSAAVTALGRYFGKHPETLPLLRERVLYDESEKVRVAAVNSFAVNFKDETGTPAVLCDWAINAAQPDTRKAAVSSLSQHFRDDPQTLPLLRERAVKDETPDVRDTAVDALIEYYQEDPQTLPLLRAIAEVSVPAEESTRVLAINALAMSWSDRIDTLPLLDKLKGENQPEMVRQAAKQAGLAVRKQRVAAWVQWLNGNSDEAQLSELPAAAEGFPAFKVRAVRLENIRAFAEPEELHLSPEDSEGAKPRPLMLLLGDNATGKSTWLRSIALASLGPQMANQVEKRPESYLRRGSQRGLIEVSFSLQLDEVSEPEALGEFCVGLEIRANENSFQAMDKADLKLGQYNAADRLNLLRRRVEDRFGFLCAYGALRGLADNPSALLPEEPKESLERVVSLFRSTSPLMDPDVLGKMLAGDLSNFRTAPARQLDEDVRQKMVEQLITLLPDVAGVDPSQASSVKLHGVSVPLRDLSEGYGSLLALVGHLFRQALSARNWKADPTKIFGVMLIDEVDLHLHPSWQRRVLLDLHGIFPNLQIICTTHSAIIAGSISSDSIVVLRREGEAIRLLSGDELPPIKGWPADQILTSILFELPTTRNVQTESLFSRYAALLKERGPKDPEVQDLGRSVAKAMDLGGETPVDIHTHQLLNEVLIARFKSLDEETQSLVLAKAGLMLSNDGSRHDQD